MNNFINKAKAVIIGHAVGDALGVPVEFRTREYLDKNPITDMIGYGTYPVPKGAWSDDTSMSLCALAGFTDSYKTAQNFVKWLYGGYFTPTGKPFDVGNTCLEAINNFIKSGNCHNCGLTDEYSNGNGSLMRIHPFALMILNTINERRAVFEIEQYKTIEQFNPDYFKNKNYIYLHNDIENIRAASALTHNHPRARLACVLYSFILWEILRNPCKNAVKNGIKNAREAYNDAIDYYTNRSGGVSYDYKAELEEFKTFQRLFDGIEKLERSEIKSDGYVVHTLEAAIWCLLTTDSYKDCVLKAVNLGNDTDTTAAVAGGLAGAMYGYDAIPAKWRNALLKREYIEELCETTFKD